MNTYPITDTNKKRELQYIRTILHNNNYPTYKQKIKHKPNNIEQNTQPNNNEKWITFTYTGKETRIITRLFKNTNVGISFKTITTIRNHIKTKKKHIAELSMKVAYTNKNKITAH
jgi:hypothetical protein